MALLAPAKSGGFGRLQPPPFLLILAQLLLSFLLFGPFVAQGEEIAEALRARLATLAETEATTETATQTQSQYTPVQTQWRASEEIDSFEFLPSRPFTTARSFCGGLLGVYDSNGVFDRSKLGSVTLSSLQTACSSNKEVDWIWRRKEVGMLNMPGSYYVIEKILKRPDAYWMSFIDAAEKNDLDFGMVQLTRNEYLNELLARPGKSSLLQAMMFTELMALMMTPLEHLHPAERMFVEYAVEYAFRLRLALAHTALDIYHVWNTVRLLEQSRNQFFTLLGYNPTPIDFNVVAMKSLGASSTVTAVSALFGYAIGARQQYKAVLQSLKVLEVDEGAKAAVAITQKATSALKLPKLTYSPKLPTSFASKWITGTTMGARAASFLKAVAGPVSIVLCAVEIAVTQLINVVKLNDALPPLEKAFNDLVAQRLTFTSSYLEKMRSSDTAFKTAAFQEMMNVFGHIADGEGTWKSLAAPAASRIANMFRGTVVCDFTADNSLQGMYLNGQSLMDRLFGDPNNWGSTKTIRFSEPLDLTSVLAFSVKEGLEGTIASYSNAYTSGFQIKCTSDDAQSPWNFVSAVDSTWKSVGLNGDTTVGGAAWWTPGPLAEDQPVIASRSTFHFADGAVPILPESSKIWATSTLATVALRKTVHRPLTRATVTCRFTAKDAIHAFYVDNMDLTETIRVGRLGSVYDAKIITFEEPPARDKVCLAVKASSYAFSATAFNSGFMIECTSTNTASLFHNLRTGHTPPPTPAPTTSLSWTISLQETELKWKAIPSKHATEDDFDWDWYTPTAYMNFPDAVPAANTFSLRGATLGPQPIWSSGSTKYVAFKRCWAKNAGLSTWTGSTTISLDDLVIQ